MKHPLQRTMGGCQSAQAGLDVRGLTISYGQPGREVAAVRDVSFTIAPGEAFGLIGESGSGKSSVAYALMRHIPARVAVGGIVLNGTDLMGLGAAELQRIRGRRLAMVYQDPMSALNPVFTVGEQVAEIIRRHGPGTPGGAAVPVRERVVHLFAQVRLPHPATIGRRYPHQLSGGQQQRVVIAMAIACEPDLLIMDEPTTGLDVTTEAVILELIADLRRSSRAAVLFISHNLSVVAKVCDRVGVLYAGQMVEDGPVPEVMGNPRHPYTIGLLGAMPRTDVRLTRLRAIPGHLPDLRQVPAGCIFRDRCESAFADCARMPDVHVVVPGHRSRCHLASRPGALVRAGAGPNGAAVRAAPAGADAAPLCLEVAGLSKTFHRGVLDRLLWRDPAVPAVADATLRIEPGRTLAIVGESGSGKSTLARCIAGLMTPTAGRIELEGRPLNHAVQRRSRAQQRAIQLIFQNPDSSLNPLHTVHEIVSRPLRLYDALSGQSLGRRIDELLESVKLGARYRDRYPHELSGGEKQRVCIARAFAARPSLIICDEPTSALDISVQAAILNELNELQARFGTSYLFISHDLAAVRQVADRVAVMYQGRILEIGTADQVLRAPSHPYTEVLLAAAARHEVGHLRGTEATAAASAAGCPFHSRCRRRLGEICATARPPMSDDGSGHAIGCHIPRDRLAQLQAQPGSPARVTQ